MGDRGGNEIRVIETLSRIIGGGSWRSAESLKLHPQVVDFARGGRVPQAAVAREPTVERGRGYTEQMATSG